MSAKPYEFQMAAGLTQPERRDEGQPVAMDTVAWGGHFREDEDDETGESIALLNQQTPATPCKPSWLLRCFRFIKYQWMALEYFVSNY